MKCNIRFNCKNEALPDPVELYEILPLGIHAYDGDLEIYFLGGRATASNRPTIYYSYDRENWLLYSDLTEHKAILNGQTLYMYGNYNNIFTIGDSEALCVRLTSSGTGKMALTGQFFSLKNPDYATKPLNNIWDGYTSTSQGSAFLNFFAGCKNNLYDARHLHFNAKSIDQNNSYNMAFAYFFQNCTHLEYGPTFDIPWDCDGITSQIARFISFFIGCTGLKEAELPYINNGSKMSRAFETFFSGCRSLEVIKYKGNYAWTSSTAANMFNGAAQTGTFYNYGNATIPVGSESWKLPTGWNIVKM